MYGENGSRNTKLNTSLFITSPYFSSTPTRYSANPSPTSSNASYTPTTGGGGKGKFLLFCQKNGKLLYKFLILFFIDYLTSPKHTRLYSTDSGAFGSSSGRSSPQSPHSFGQR